MKIYNSKEELIEDLKDFAANYAKQTIAKYKITPFDKINKTPAQMTQDELLFNSAAGSMWRPFNDEKPSVRYDAWIHDESTLTLLKPAKNGFLNITSQKEYDDFVYCCSDSLVKSWRSSLSETIMQKGLGMKIINLIMKHQYYKYVILNIDSGKIKDLKEVKKIKQLEFLLHVPWDTYTLQPIREIFHVPGIPKIPKGRGMTYVKSFEIYEALYKFISGVCAQANVPKAYYEFMTWDLGHQT
jgi:hypothetical protein